MSATDGSSGAGPAGASQPELGDCRSGSRPGECKNSAMLTAGIIIADVVGAGILGMPAAVAQFGWLMGTIMLIVMMLMNMHICMVLWRVRMAHPGARTLGDLAAASFSGCPPWQTRLVMALTTGPQHTFLFGLMGLCVVLCAKGLGMMFYETEYCLPRWAIIVAVLILPVATSARELGSYKSLIWLNVLTLVGTLMIPLVHMTVVGTEESRALGSEVVAISEMTFSGVLFALSCFCFGFTSEFMLTEIIDDMEDPAEFPKAYMCFSAPFQCVAFLTAGVGGYYFIGDKGPDMIDQAIPFGPTFRVAAACLFTHIFCTYVTKGIIVCQAAHATVDPEFAGSGDRRWRSWAVWNVVVVSVLVAAYGAANVVPFFADAVNLLGASVTPWVCWVLPNVFFWRMYRAADEKPRISRSEWMLMGAEVLLALFLMIFGTLSAVRTLVDKWDTYGYPFACHCEEMWKTCECSGGHVGMEECLFAELR